jgi:hypothetical protein
MIIALSGAAEAAAVNPGFDFQWTSWGQVGAAGEPSATENLLNGLPYTIKATGVTVEDCITALQDGDASQWPAPSLGASGIANWFNNIITSKANGGWGMGDRYQANKPGGFPLALTGQSLQQFSDAIATAAVTWATEGTSGCCNINDYLNFVAGGACKGHTGYAVLNHDHVQDGPHILDLNVIMWQLMQEGYAGNGGAADGNQSPWFDNQTDYDAMVDGVRAVQYERLVDQVKNGQAISGDNIPVGMLMYVGGDPDTPGTDGYDTLGGGTQASYGAPIYDWTDVNLVAAATANPTPAQKPTKIFPDFPSMRYYHTGLGHGGGGYAYNTYQSDTLPLSHGGPAGTNHLVNLADYATGAKPFDAYVVENIGSGEWSPGEGYGAPTWYFYRTAISKPRLKCPGEVCEFGCTFTANGVPHTAVGPALGTNDRDDYIACMTKEDYSSWSASGCHPVGYAEATLDLDWGCILEQQGSSPRFMVDNEGDPMTAMHAVTGKVKRNHWRYYLSLYRPAYSGLVVVSGDFPVITGTCDWSAGKSQNWKSGIYDDTHEMAGESYWWLEGTPEDITEGREVGDKYYGTYSMPEAYYVEYPTDSAVVLTGVGGLTLKQKQSRTAGNLRANEPKLTPEQALAKAKKIVDGPHNTGEVHAMVVTAQGTAGGTYDQGSNSSTNLLGANDSRGDISFVGGWPLMNQEYKETQNLHSGPIYSKTTPFGWKCLLLDDEQARRELGKTIAGMGVGKVNDYLNATVVGRAGVGATGGTVQTVLNAHTPKLQLQTQVFSNRAKFDAMVGNATRLQNLAEHHSYLLNIKNDGVLTDKGSDKTKSRNILIFIYKNSATACDTCVGHGVVGGAAGSAGGGAAGTNNVAVGDEVMFFNENQKIGMGVTWELRSGNWEFSVPYSTESTIVPDPRGWHTVGGAQKHDGSQLRLKPWFRMVQDEWGANEFYTGQESFWSLPRDANNGLYNFEIGCNIDNAQSKLDKVIDWHNTFGDSASYEEMRKRVKDENNNLLQGGSREYDTEQ